MTADPDHDQETLLGQIFEDCWAVEHAEKLALVVDGADYFRAAKQTMLLAKHSIMLIGWDFDARIELEPGGSALEGPSKAGQFFTWLAKRRPELTIRLLKWDMGLLKSLFRGETPLFMVNWLSQKNVRFRLDGAHPKLATHHMKLLVIDDALAFCGGIDMTVGRWDTRQHTEDDERRRSPWGRQLGPWHDATSCVSGPIAVKLGELARERWRRATGEVLSAPPHRHVPWPDNLPIQFEEIPMGIARTVARYEDYPQVSEIEAITLRLIKDARTSLYIESQYLASRTVAVALAERLQEQDGPDILLVTPETADGWLEAKAMDSARARLLTLIRNADRYNRFRCVYPVNEAGSPIYVHAKIMIADDRLLKIGSANLNNRSMGFDTECDLLLDAERSADSVVCSAAIRDYRNGLLAEHLGVDASLVTAQADGRRLLSTVEELNQGKRGLVDLKTRPLTAGEEIIAEADLVDPERPSSARAQLMSVIS